jgi:catechol 2,3-dioxygenase-like lactoylglutathione lyase family enzyme
VDQRVSVVTLGVGDVARSRAFYTGLGWEPALEPDGRVIFFQARGLVFALWALEDMEAETGVTGGRPGGLMLAHNVGTDEEVDGVLDEAARAGGTVVAPARRMEWGGYSGAFADPDGHLWEVAHNPFWTIYEDGTVSLQPPGTP